MSQQPKTLIEWLDDRCPPFLAIALARRGVAGKTERITPDEIAKATGLSTRLMWRLFGQVSWEKHSIEQISKILVACNIDVFRMRPHRMYMVQTIGYKNPYKHIPERSRKQFFRRLARMMKLAEERKRQNNQTAQSAE